MKPNSLLRRQAKIEYVRRQKEDQQLKADSERWRVDRESTKQKKESGTEQVMGERCSSMETPEWENA
jgi:hypothetical protein